MSTNRREFMKLTGLGVAGAYLGSSFSTASLLAGSESHIGDLSAQVTSICTRLARHGWRNLFLKVTQGELDFDAPNLADALRKPIVRIDRSLPGFEDFAGEGQRAIEPGAPARSLLFHALASPNVIEDGDRNVLTQFPTLAEIETVENYVYGAEPPSLDDMRARANGAPLAVVVYCREYRSAKRTVQRKHADVCFSRTGIARLGTAGAMYDPRRRDFISLDEENPFAFRVLPTQFAAYLAMKVKGDADSFGPMRSVAGDSNRDFWVPLHKLFAGRECLSGYDLEIDFEAHFVNEKLRRLHVFLEEGGYGTNWKEADRQNYPFVMKDSVIARFSKDASYGTGVIEPQVHPLFEKAEYQGQPLTFGVPGKYTGQVGGLGFSSMQIIADAPDNIFRDEIVYMDGTNPQLGRTSPQYINARHQVLPDGSERDLNEDPQMMDIIQKGGYRALHFVDFSGDGWVAASCPQLVGTIDESVPAYVGIAPPDFFPAISQGDLAEWAREDAPQSIRRSVWCIAPLPLSDRRMAGNVTLAAGFDIHDDTITAVISHPHSGNAQQRPFVANDAAIFTRLPDGSNGVFDPGWDFSQDTLKTSNGNKLYLANYGLGVPFVEDAKLCAALGSYWPAVSPDATRAFAPQKRLQRALWPFPTIVPLTDEEIGSVPTDEGEFMPWDGVRGPQEVTHEGQRMMRYAEIFHVDYLNLAGKMTAALTARIDLAECQARVVAMAAVYWALGIREDEYLDQGDWNVGLKNDDEFSPAFTEALAMNRLNLAKSKLSVGSFQKLRSEADLRAARSETRAELVAPVYKVSVYTPGVETKDPKDFRYVLVEMKAPVEFYVDSKQLLKRTEGGEWERHKLFAT